MTFPYSPNARRSASGSLLARWLEGIRPHPDTFVCGVRWPDGGHPGGSSRWQYRRVWVDDWRDGGVVAMRFGQGETMRIRLDPDPWWSGGSPTPRAGLDVLSGRSTDSGAQVLIAVPPGELVRFGIGGL